MLNCTGTGEDLQYIFPIVMALVSRLGAALGTNIKYATECNSPNRAEFTQAMLSQVNELLKERIDDYLNEESEKDPLMFH